MRFSEAAARAAGLACALLGWRPGEFWAATPAELVTALRGVSRDDGEALDAAALAALRERFPDGR